jgi:hypothetical protein
MSFHCCSIFTHVSSGGSTKDPLAAAVPQRESLTPSQQRRSSTCEYTDTRYIWGISACFPFRYRRHKLRIRIALPRALQSTAARSLPIFRSSQSEGRAGREGMKVQKRPKWRIDRQLTAIIVNRSQRNLQESKWKAVLPGTEQETSSRFITSAINISHSIGLST